MLAHVCYLCYLARDLVTFHRVDLNFSGGVVLLHKELPELRTASDPNLQPSQSQKSKSRSKSSSHSKSRSKSKARSKS